MSTTTAPRVDTFDTWLRVTFSYATGDHADFHYLWLRHNGDDDRHPLTGEKTRDVSELPADVRPTAARIDGEALALNWPDGVVGRFAFAWLREHAYAHGRELRPPPPGDVTAIELDARPWDVNTVVQRALNLVWERGAVVVRAWRSAPGVAPEHDTEPLIQAFERRGLAVVPTHFGRIEDLRTDNTTNANTDQLGYTDAAVDLHTDQPFLESPPKWQLLQAVRPAIAGGDSYLCDARAAAHYLRSVDEHAYELLTGVSVVFHRKQKSFEKRLVSPVLVPDGPRGFQVRFSYFTMAPHKVPFARMTAFYEAYRRFTTIVRNPAHQYRFRLEAGDFVLYDNLRMLHARTAFTGGRWVRGIYFDEPADGGAAI